MHLTPHDLRLKRQTPKRIVLQHLGQDIWNGELIACKVAAVLLPDVGGPVVVCFLDRVQEDVDYTDPWRRLLVPEAFPLRPIIEEMLKDILLREELPLIGILVLRV